MKLELKHLAPYLPYELKWTLQELMTYTMSGITNETLYTEEGKVLNWNLSELNLPQALFPILKPLSELPKDENEHLLDFEYVDTDGYTDGLLRDRLTTTFDRFKLDGDYYLPIEMPYDFVTHLISLHYDVFGLIEKGLAIDINTIK